MILFRKIVLKLSKLFLSIISAIIIFPVSFIIPKKKSLIIFIGESGNFMDNVKYLYLHCHENNKHAFEYYFLTNKVQCYNELKSSGLPVLLYPTIISVFMLLRAKIVVVDGINWVYKCKYYLAFFSFKVQLWHGVGFKTIEKEMYKKYNKFKRFLLKIYFALTARFPLYDLFISTSPFYSENVFSKGFRLKRIVDFGYPRNDIMHKKDFLNFYLLGADNSNINKVEDAVKDGFKILLYVPTFRDKGLNPIEDGALNLKKLNSFCEENKIKFVIKFHLLTRVNNNVNKELFNNIIFYDSSKDIYPLYSNVDLMLTDYSSIYMDFLHLNRPIFFFNYDFEIYNSRDRKLQFDYDEMTPGPKCFSQEDLQCEIYNFIQKGQDKYKEIRSELFKKAFLYYDGDSSKRIFEELLKI
ncbi:MAG: CDP-glycerol glycerophosphotransferase family protein [Pseudomonadota bacterium]